MTEEIKTEIKEEKKVCKCKELRFFLLNILASFLGCLVALCIYSAATKPQLPPPMKCPCNIQQMEHGRHHMKGAPNMKMHRQDIRPVFEHKHFNGGETGQKPPIENK